MITLFKTANFTSWTCENSKADRLVIRGVRLYIAQWIDCEKPFPKYCLKLCANSKTFHTSLIDFRHLESYVWYHEGSQSLFAHLSGNRNCFFLSFLKTRGKIVPKCLPIEICRLYAMPIEIWCINWRRMNKLIRDHLGYYLLLLFILELQSVKILSVFRLDRKLFHEFK